MRRRITIQVVAVFGFCLAFIFPSRAMAKITHGTAACPKERITQMKNGGVGCFIELPYTQANNTVAMPPGSINNPGNWGMCGVLGVSGSFGPLTVARIFVGADGLYGVELVGNTPRDVPTLDWTCVLFRDFTGVPSATEASYFAPPSHNGNIAGSAGNACIWAGLFGDLTRPSSEGGFGDTSAQFYGPETVIGSQNVTTYAFCSGYKAASWHGWKYFHHGGGAYAPPSSGVPLGVNEAQYWCYIDRVKANLTYPNYKIGPISANLSTSGGNYSMAATPPGGTLLNYNCLPLKQ